MALSSRQTPDGSAHPEIQAGAPHNIAQIRCFPHLHDRGPDQGRDNVFDLRELEAQSDALEVRFEADQGSLWCAFNHGDRPCFTPKLLHAIRRLQIRLQRGLGTCANGDGIPLRTLVWTSTVPGIWNLGGDLKLFVELIRAQAETELRRYAHTCVDVVYQNLCKLDLPVLTIALVQGDALGGGFEAVLTNDVIVAERGSKFGLPEILFHMFPGMGAYSLLCRRLDGCRAQQLILSGRLYDAEELERMGLVDLVVEPGTGRSAVRDWLARNQRRHAVLRRLSEVRRRCQPVSYDELIEVTELWVATALGLDEADLRRMERLAAAQQRRRDRERQPSDPSFLLSAAG
jgi:DSF synthase